MYHQDSLLINIYQNQLRQTRKDNQYKRQYLFLYKPSNTDYSHRHNHLASIRCPHLRSMVIDTKYMNQSTQNIGARRLYTIMERLLEELSFESPEMNGARVPVNAAYVRQRLDEVTRDEDLSRYIL